MTDTTKSKDLSKKNHVIGSNDFVVKLEKAAMVFLNLLQKCQHYKVKLFSISAVCDILKFIQDHADLEHTSVKHVRAETLKTQQSRKTIRGSQPIISDIAATVKRRRENKRPTMEVVKTQSTQQRKSKRRTRYTGVNKKKHSENIPAQKQGAVDNNIEENIIQEEANILTNCVKSNENHDLSPLPKLDKLSEFQCSYCYKVFIDRRNLKSHLWVHEREKNFQCDICQKLFLRSHQLTRHRRVHTGEKPYPCVVCGKAFADISNLNTHTRKEHPNHVASLLRCDVCGKESQTRKDLRVHLAAHEEHARENEQNSENTSNYQQHSTQSRTVHENGTGTVKSELSGKSDVFLCQICGKSVNKRAALLSHMKRHIRQKDFRCEFCNKTFPELQQLKNHRQEHTGDRPYKCEKCSKGFKSQGTLRSHLAVHSGEQPYSCDVCGRTFSQTSGLNQHKLKHTAEEEKMLGSTNRDSKYSCGVCGRCYKTKFRLQLHLRSHDTKRDVSCNFCDKKFQTTQELAMHHRSHTKDRYSCRVCGASFKSRSVYYFHTRTHQIDRPFLCSVCGRSFTSTNDLKVHKRRHSIGGHLRKSLDRFICSVCGRVYQMKNSLLIHMKIHQGIFDHPCDFCEKKFKSHAELRHHRRVHTQEKPYTCETCNRRFSRHSTLINHRRTHSGERPYMCTSCGATFKLSCTLKKHAKIHAREVQGGKTRSSINGKAKSRIQESAPLLKAQKFHQHQLQQQQHLEPQQQLQNSSPMSLQTQLVPQFLHKHVPMLEDNSGQTNIIQELKPVSTSGMQLDNSDLINDRRNTILLDPRQPSQCLIRHDEIETGDRETRNLTEMRNVAPNPTQYTTGGNSFTAYYYY